MDIYKQSIRQWSRVATPVRLHQYQTLTSSTMHIRNSCFEHRLFRKIHLEYAVSGPVQIFHHVAYPWPWADIPILGADILYVHGDATMGIVDMSLDTKHEVWSTLMTSLRDETLGGTPRSVPEWGRPIFSDDVVFLDRPDTSVFEAYILRLQDRYAQLAMTAGQRKNHTAFHQLYCTQQLKNTKTKTMLESHVGPDITDAYMRNIMFDVQ